jgi:peptidoglycan/LPS O-acetylase OafA/YrhL
MTMHGSSQPTTGRAPARYTPPAVSSRDESKGSAPGASTGYLDDTARIAELDGLRGIAVAMVIFLHYVVRWQASRDVLQHIRPLWGLLDLTWSGVDLFFVISGFLIGGILLDNRESPRLLRTFYVRRACRILPPYLLLVGLSFAPFFGGLSAASNSPIPFGAYLLLIQNWWTSAGVRPAHWLSPTWSVAIEEQFYLVAPLVVTMLSRRALVRVVLACITIAPLLRVAAVVGLIPVAPWDFTLARIDAPAFGVLGALLMRDAGSRAALQRHAVALRRSVPVLLVGWVALSQIRLLSWGQAAGVTVGLSYLALMALVLVLVVQLGPESLAARIARTPALVRVGQRSYFLYLFHTPLIGVLAILPVPLFVRVAVAVALLWMLAEVSWRRIEEPILRLGRRLRYA